MISVSRIAIAGVTLAVAGGTGYYLQRPAQDVSVDAAQDVMVSANQPNQALVAPDSPESAGIDLGEVMKTDGGVAIQDVASLSTAADAEALPQQPDALGQTMQVAALDTAPDLANTGATLQLAALSTDQTPATGAQADQLASPECEIILSAEVEAAAMVHLYLDAPCRKGERVTIQHESMAFTEVTSMDGLLDVAVPAFSETGIFYAFFGDSEGAMVDIAVPGVGMYDRVALLWQGDSGLQVHAREFGADYGDAGHVWAEEPRAPEYAVQARGGFMTRLGNSGTLQPQMAEIYTFPSGATQDSGTVRLSVEAEITAANCNRDIQALSVQSAAGEAAEVVEMSLSVPGCQTIGDFLVLNSLLRDLKVAGN